MAIKTTLLWVAVGVSLLCSIAALIVSVTASRGVHNRYDFTYAKKPPQERDWFVSP